MTPGGAGEAVAFDVLDSGPRSGIRADDPEVRAADGPDGWAEVWADHGVGDPPPFDPRDRWVGLVLLGERPTGGYAVDVVDVRAREGRYVVGYREEAPGPEDVVTQSLTRPWAAVAVDRAAGAPDDVALEPVDGEG